MKVLGKINKIKIKRFNTVNVKNGKILKILDSRQRDLKNFKDAYFSFIKYNKIKGWKKHLKMTMTLYVPVGKVQFVFYDEKKFISILIGENKFYKIIVPPNIWFAFRGASKGVNLVFNLANIKHNDKEVIRKTNEQIKYKWETK
jgi:dTDP-4-dehydrorhamnose 3,5-epimerase|tara:strand:+ start:197 stop:628 length:432 start_codon:yes stop_codon:yes gene_type:complete